MARLSPVVRLLLWTMLAIALWLGAAWGYEIFWSQSRGLGTMLFLSQDFPALVMMLGGLALAIPFAAGKGEAVAPHLSRRTVGWAIVAFALLAWLAARFWFDGYALSRDEEVAQFGAAYLREGLLARPIPEQWLAYRRAIMPEFFLSFGADKYWASAYLPVNSAFRALAMLIGDAALTGPLLLLLGLGALWNVTQRLFPDRADARLVVLVMVLSSVQLLLTAATPYAMTAHFALNMLWLALVLHDTRWSHVAAGVTALLLAGVHQWHFPLIFLAPFILWFGLQRRWGVMLFHAGVMVLAVLLWAKLWPALLQMELGAPADVMPAKGVGHKLGSLFARLGKWHPLLHISRFLAWNNILLVPLAVLGCWRADWRAQLRGAGPVLPLALGCAGAALLAIDQGYGWGYRYLHGYIGAFALLAGYGWIALGKRNLRPLWLSVLLALFVGAFLAQRAHDYVQPFADTHRLIHAADADVVLVDPRGGRFVTDLVRGAEGQPLGRPVVLSLSYLNEAKLDDLCARGSLAILDRSAFLPLGVSPLDWGSERLAALRAHLDEIGCGRVISAPPR